MGLLQNVEVRGRSLDELRAFADHDEFGAAEAVFRRVREDLVGRTVWNLNSTPVGGGVAEMLRPLVGYCRGMGVDGRWLVIGGSPEFFRVTKRLHHALHGSAGDGSALGPEARAIYDRTLTDNALELCAVVHPGDVVVAHDPQTAGLVPQLCHAGADVIWRCHVGADEPSSQSEAGWAFLAPYLEGAGALVFSRSEYIPAVLAGERCVVIQPGIDASSAKNQEMDERTARAILAHTGLVEGPPPQDGQRIFRGDDGTPRRVDRRADVLRLGRAPTWNTPLVAQISRWDPLKDAVGVMRGFATAARDPDADATELVLAGPNVHGVVDDPEGEQEFARVVEAWRALPHAIRARVHLACLPTADPQENAAIVNALQRHAHVLVQKSLREGFGLTVTEAMWKGKPVVASAVGGIQDQIEDGISGLLLPDPGDAEAFAAALARLRRDPGLARQLGKAARDRVRRRFLGFRQLLDYARLIEGLGPP